MYTSLSHVHVVTNVSYRYAYVHIVQEHITMCKNVSYEHVGRYVHVHKNSLLCVQFILCTCIYQRTIQVCTCTNMDCTLIVHDVTCPYNEWPSHVHTCSNQFTTCVYIYTCSNQCTTCVYIFVKHSDFSLKIIKTIKFYIELQIRILKYINNE